MKTSWLPFLIIAIISCLLFLPNLGSVHLFDWDEINFAELAREMIVTGNYSQLQIGFLPFWEKPPFFIWIQAVSMHLFGVNDFAARLPNALVGMLTLCVIFHIGRKWFDEKLGWMWVMVYAGSFLPHLYFKSGIIDPVFNMFIFLAVYQLVQLALVRYERRKGGLRHAVLAGLFMGLGVLTKGPVAILMAGLTAGVFLFLHRTEGILRLADVLGVLIATLVVLSGWFGIELLQNGSWFVEEFIRYQVRLLTTSDAGHAGPFYYHFIVLLIGCFPASVFLFGAFGRNAEATNPQRFFKQAMLILLAMVLLVFSIVQTKIVHYSSLAYFPLTFLSAYGLYRIRQGSAEWRRAYSWLTGVIGFTIGIALFGLPLLIRHLDRFTAHIKDPFMLANLEADVTWSGVEWLIGGCYFILLIICLVLFTRRSYVAGVRLLFLSTLLVIQSTLYVIVPKVERYTQGAAVDFYKTLRDKDCYVEVLGFKSYAHLFYARTGPFDGKPPYHDDPSRREWLLRGKIDKAAYFVTRIDRLDRLDLPADVRETGRSNGFVFFHRPPP